MRIGIHQPNFIPWFPFFYKMAMCDIFILHSYAQFEKNGYQNRFRYKDKWITKPVHQRKEPIYFKDYVGLEKKKDIFHNGGSVHELNYRWIIAIRDTLNIKTPVYCDNYVQAGYSDNPTKGLIRLIQYHEGDTYITNPDAKNKYLDEDLMNKCGIKVEYCQVPKNLQVSIFEMFEECGIEGTIKQLPRGR